MKIDTPVKGRRKVPLYVMLPPEERAQLVAFAASIGRPLSWTVRDALRVYLDAVRKAGSKLADLRAEVSDPDIDIRKAGKTEPSPQGRPRKAG